MKVILMRIYKKVLLLYQLFAISQCLGRGRSHAIIDFVQFHLFEWYKIMFNLIYPFPATNIKQNSRVKIIQLKQWIQMCYER